MSASPVFSNLTGTTSLSFTVGKQGVKLLQGTANPSGLTAPTGSLYLQKSTGGIRVYQVDGVGVWHSILFQADLVQGSGITITDNLDGTVTISAAPSKYKLTFTNATLSAGILSIPHGLGEDYPIIQVYNNNRSKVEPDSTYTIDANNASIDLTTYGAITGSWTVTVISS